MKQNSEMEDYKTKLMNLSFKKEITDYKNGAAAMKNIRAGILVKRIQLRGNNKT